MSEALLLVLRILPTDAMFEVVVSFSLCYLLSNLACFRNTFLLMGSLRIAAALSILRTLWRTSVGILLLVADVVAPLPKVPSRSYAESRHLVYSSSRLSFPIICIPLSSRYPAATPSMNYRHSSPSLHPAHAMRHCRTQTVSALQ